MRFSWFFAYAPTKQITSLVGRDQSFFGVQREHSSPSLWSAARYELSFLDKMGMPSQKLEVLLNTARAIYNTYHLETLSNVRNRRPPPPPGPVPPHVRARSASMAQAAAAASSRGSSIEHNSSPRSAWDQGAGDGSDEKERPRSATKSQQQQQGASFIAADEFFPVTSLFLCCLVLSFFWVFLFLVFWVRTS